MTPRMMEGRSAGMIGGTYLVNLPHGVIFAMPHRTWPGLLGGVRVLPVEWSRPVAPYKGERRLKRRALTLLWVRSLMFPRIGAEGRRDFRRNLSAQYPRPLRSRSETLLPAPKTDRAST
jgi:hypothetical protein